MCVVALSVPWAACLHSLSCAGRRVLRSSKKSPRFAGPNPGVGCRAQYRALTLLSQASTTLAWGLFCSDRGPFCRAAWQAPQDAPCSQGRLNVGAGALGGSQWKCYLTGLGFEGGHHLRAAGSWGPSAQRRQEKLGKAGGAWEY